MSDGDNQVWIGRDLNGGTLAVGDGATVNVSGRDMISSSGPQTTLDPHELRQVMTKLDKIVSGLEAYRDKMPDPQDLLDSARAATEEARKRNPRRGVILAHLRELSTDLAPVVALVAAVKPVLDEVVKLVH